MSQEVTLISQVRDKGEWKSYFIAFGTILICTLIAQLAVPVFELANIVMVYILGVVIVATKYGLKPSIFASFLSVAAFDVFFVPPFHTFAVEEVQYLFTFAVMLVISIVISTLTARIRQQSESDRMSERRTAALYTTSRALASQLNLEEIVKIGLKHLCDVFDCKSAVVFPERETDFVSAEDPSHGLKLEEIDQTISDWVFESGLKAGKFSDKHGTSDKLYFPLRGSEAVIGVLVVFPSEQPKRGTLQIDLLETFVNQIALASERALLAEEAEQTRIKIKTEELRNSLLSCVSHDLRTPLATITGAASCIMDDDGSLEGSGYRELAREVYGESVRLNTLVGKLLDMTKIASGTLRIKQEWQPIDELITSAVTAVAGEHHNVSVKLADEMAVVYADPILIEQVIINLLENAIKYSPLEGKISIEVDSDENEVKFTVSDQGPGVEEALQEMVFDKFYRVNDTAGSTGVGLGLAICKGIVEAHGGRIWMKNKPEGGALFIFTLPEHQPAIKELSVGESS